MVENKLMRTGAMVRVRLWERTMLYKVVAHKILLYGRDISVVTGAMLKVLENFHQWAARRITGYTDRHTVDRYWKSPQWQMPWRL